MRSVLPTLITLAVSSSVQAVTWSIAQNYSGSTFFDNWVYQNGIDANTTGNVLYQTQTQAVQENLTYLNSAGHAIIKVDNTTSGVGDPTYGRASIKILSQATVPMGSLTVLDAVHMPFGCSVWPAYWMEGPNWPYDGEIDIVENVNLASTNQYALHTTQGCQHPSAADSVGIETGVLQQADCFNVTNGNTGCLVQDSSSNSFGAGFASVGGGVFATLWDNTGISIWFFPRQSIPSDVNSAHPDPTTWPTPTAFYPQADCDTQKFFTPQTIIFDISICGNFAGLASVFTSTGCTGTCTDLVDDPSNYNDAYFEISYLHVYTNGTSTTGTSTASGSGAGSTGGSTTSGKNGAMALSSMFSIFAMIFVPAVIALGFVAL